MMHKKLPLWDLPTRLFHWLLVLFIFAAWRTAETGNMELHQTFGFLILGLMIFRIIWGFIGSQPSKFSDFIFKPLTIIKYALQFFKQKSEISFGHNPMGGIVVVLFLALILTQIISGLFADNDIDFAGPLSEYAASSTVRDITLFHKFNFNVLLFSLICIHIGVIIFYFVYKKNNLLTPMISGYKTITKQETPKPMRSNAMGLSVMIACIALSLFAKVLMT